MIMYAINYSIKEIKTQENAQFVGKAFTNSKNLPLTKECTNRNNEEYLGNNQQQSKTVLTHFPSKFCYITNFRIKMALSCLLGQLCVSMEWELQARE